MPHRCIALAACILLAACGVIEPTSTPMPTVDRTESARSARQAAFMAQPPENALRSPDGQFLAAADPTYGETMVGLWNAESGEFIRMLHARWPSVSGNGLRFSPNSRRLVVQSSMGFSLWNLDTMESQMSYSVYLEGRLNIVYSSDMQLAAIYGCRSIWGHGSCGDPFLKVVEMDTGEMMYQTMRPRPYRIDSVTFEEDAQQLGLKGCFSEWDYARCQDSGATLLDLTTGEVTRMQDKDEQVSDV